MHDNEVITIADDITPHDFVAMIAMLYLAAEEDSEEEYLLEKLGNLAAENRNVDFNAVLERMAELTYETITAQGLAT